MLIEHAKPRKLAGMLLVAAAALGMYSASATAEDKYVPPTGRPGPAARPGFPSYAAHTDAKVDSMRSASGPERDRFCKAYCARVLGWKSEDFKKSSIAVFFQTPEDTDVRCDFSETSQNIGGSEKHSGPSLNAQCEQRQASRCYWSINYGRQHQGRVACVRPVVVP